MSISRWRQALTAATPWREGLAALLPGACLLCGANSHADALCPACLNDLPSLPAGCPHCALPSQGDNACGHCLRHPPAFDSCHAPWRYAFPADRLIQALKYGHQLCLAPLLARAMLVGLPSHLEVTRVIAVPLHPQRLAQRGFNQAVELARPLARHLECPLDLSSLQRHQATRIQAELPLSERHANVRLAFTAGASLAGESILLVDDVMTSGATLNACANALRAQGARHIHCVVAARALPH